MANFSSENRRIEQKAQSVAESALMLVAALLFFLGIWRIGLWYNNEMAERQSAYQESRVDAGSDEVGQWPVYARRPLTENWTLEGEEFPPPALAAAENGGVPGRDRRGGVGDCENSDRIQELIHQADERKAQVDEPVKELQDQADELDRQAGELEKQAEELQAQAGELDRQAGEADRLSNEQMQRYNDCLGNCEAQRATCTQNCQAQYDSCSSQCLPYLNQAQEYSSQAEDYRRQAQERRSQAEVPRRQAQEKRAQSSQKREEAKSLMREVTDLLNEAGRLGKECGE